MKCRNVRFYMQYNSEICRNHKNIENESGRQMIPNAEFLFQNLKAL